MRDATTRDVIVTELYNRYQANGFISEDEALACFVAHKIALYEIDSITEHLLTLGVIIKVDSDDDDIETYGDRSKLDYNQIFEEVIALEPSLATFIEYIRNITPPQNRETQNLIPQAHNGNTYARTRLIEMYLRTIIKQALFYSNRYMIPLEDTIQDGVLGLIIAVDKFNPKEREKFSTYAPWWVGQIIQRQMRFSPSPLFYFPAHVQEQLYSIFKDVNEHFYNYCYISDYNQNLVKSITQKLFCSVEIAKKLLRYFFPVMSIETELTQNEQLFSDYNNFEEQLIDSISKNDINSTLSDREQKVIDLRFGLLDNETRTLEEIGLIMGITKERIRQIEAKAITKLRHSLL